MGQRGDTGPTGPPGPSGTPAILVGGQYGLRYAGAGRRVLASGGHVSLNAEIAGCAPHLLLESETGALTFARAGRYIVQCLLYAEGLVRGDKAALRLTLNGETAVSHDILLGRNIALPLVFLDVITVAEENAVLRVETGGADIVLNAEAAFAASLTVWGLV